MIKFSIDKNSRTPFYTQLVRQFEKACKNGEIVEGETLPSMNALASSLDISRETAKKTYGILRDHGLVEPRQGKGFFVKGIGSSKYLRVLIISDVHSIYKQILLSAFQNKLSTRGDCDVTVLLHNQDIHLLNYFLDRNMDNYDWFVVVPHFPLDDETQKEVLKQLRRIPNRKLILLDRWPELLPGNYGAVYQDFERDAPEALEPYVPELKNKGRLNVIALDSSLYKQLIEEGLRSFANRFGINIVFYTGIPEKLMAGDICLILSSQHDNGLVALAKRIEEQGLTIGRDVFIISYNDIPLNELVLNGLSSISTDFEKMGETAAEMILTGRIRKVHNPFQLIRRNTF